MLFNPQYRNMAIAALTGLFLAACGSSSDSNTESGSNDPTPTPTADFELCGSTEVVGGEVMCVLTGTIVNDITLTSDKRYLLKGAVIVGEAVSATGEGGDPAVMTIEAGTTIVADDRGANNTAPPSYLTIARGSQLIADGTSTAPIIFTSKADYTGSRPINVNDSFTGEWGGIVINGRARVNEGSATAGTDCATATGSDICVGEAEGDGGAYGGDNDADNSGTLRYVQVKYAGITFDDETELNGIGFFGVGSGTTVDYVQVHNNKDDGVEFFGGSVDVSHLVVTGSADDSIDWTEGWTGDLQYAVILQNPNNEGDYGIEGEDASAAPTGASVPSPLTQPNLSNLTFVGTAGNTGVQFKKTSSGKLYNSVVTGFDTCLEISNASTTDLTGDNAIVMKSNLWDCATAVTATSDADATVAASFQDAANGSTTSTTNTLSGTYINGAAENSVTAADTSELGSFFDTVDYIGAVENSAGDWTQGWTYGLGTPGCPVGTQAVTGGCELSGTITRNTHLVNVTGRTYFLSGGVTVGQDCGPTHDGQLTFRHPTTNLPCQAAVLKIDAGVTVAARAEVNGNPSYLTIARGSQLQVNGTASSPVVFTVESSANPVVATSTGLWGGLVINGQARVNEGSATAGTDCATATGDDICQGNAEGDGGLYGGIHDDDDSGHIRYAQILYAGKTFDDTTELNGIGFFGVGNGTEVSYVQVHNNKDDGVEFFGGSVNADHLVLTQNSDDTIDWTEGWTGSIQFAVVVQDDSNVASDRGIEGEDASAAPTGATLPSPHTNPRLANITFVNTDGENIGVELKKQSGGTLVNSVIVGFNKCLEIDGAAVTDLGENGANANAPKFQSNLWDCTTALSTDGTADAAIAATYQSADTNGSTTTSNTLTAPTGGSYAYINGAAETAITTVDNSDIDSDFVDTDYIGAVEQGGTNWTTGWTVFLND